MFYYVYVLESLKTKELYIGYSTDLKKRLAEHNRGRVY
ncbi:MAG: GIY-YIG nuclease family protein [candidate division WWE3 bacterium]|nr:GIY-YIG nuclease family protein [candidate division WWE3 bacterium]